jgi:hypothetical protein
MNSTLLISGVRDNFKRGNVGEFLRNAIQPGAQLSIVSAYFTILALEKAKSSIERTFPKRTARRLTERRKAILPEVQNQMTEDT